MLDAVAVPSPLIIVEEARDHTPAFFLGFMAVGSGQDMAALEKRAAELRLPARRSENHKNEPEVMIMFPPGTDHAAGARLYRDALGGAFGKLKLEVMVITQKKASDGIDLDKDVTVEDPSFIRAPSE